ncbi:MAG: M6 family metalloprotease domain-containing protein [Muribaculaceae bacterium]|nr:M6 family metalloprotease domain-containing protein [Muribaculaceae bacterium]
MGRLLSLLAIAALCCGVSLAVPAKRTPLTVVQSDGSTIVVTPVGDEFCHSLLTSDGLTVCRGEDGNVYYETASGSTKVLAHEASARSASELSFIAGNASALKMSARTPRRTPRRGPLRANSFTQVPQTGSPHIPIILVNYKDIKFKSSNPVAQFEGQFNTNAKSCLQYFVDQSRGLFTPEFDILGPVTMPNNRATYGGNVGGNDKGVGTMVALAVKGLQDEVDFSKYDNDGDGEVDVVVVLYAGVGEAQATSTVPNSVWPCQWDLNDSYANGCSAYSSFDAGQDGKTALVNKFAVFNELSGSSDNTTVIDGVGTFCHEFSHCLGLPDFYDTRNTWYSNYGMNAWSLMDYGCYNDDGNTPIGYDAYEREFMGWLTPIVPTPGQSYTLDPLNLETGEAVKIYNDKNQNEYFYLECRQQTGWDAFMEASGLMITHVDYDADVWNGNTVNNTSSHQRMTVVPADNDLSEYTNSGDLWPYNGKNEFTDSSEPAANVFTGSKLGKPVTGITKTGNKVSFVFMEGEGPQHEVPELLDATEEQIGNTSFTASWNGVEDVESYTLQVNIKKDVDVEQLIEETFPTTKFDGTGTRDLGSQLDSYMDNEGWTGERLYKGLGAIRIGTSTATGSLVSPELDIDASSCDVVTVLLRMAPFNKDTDVNVNVSIGEESQTVTVSSEQDYLLQLPVSGEESTVTISTVAKSKRVLLSYVGVWAGEYEPEEGAGINARRDATETGDENSRTITGITGESYTVNDLTAGASYRYKLKAIYTDGSESDWSATKQVALGDPDPVIITDLSEDALDFGTITLGSGAVSQTLGVLASDLKADVTLALADESNSFAIDVTTIAQADAEEGAEVVVTYDPQTYGSHTATLTISSTDAEPVVVTLTGVAELEKEVPVLDELDESGVNASAFRASWGTVANVSSYTLQVDVKQDTPEPVVELLLDEDFSVPANTTWVRSLSGTYNETSEGYLRLGTTSLVGSITSPAVNLTASNGLATVIVTAKSYGNDDNVEMKVSIIDDDENVVDSKTVTLTNSDADYEIVLTGNASNNNHVRIESLASRKRVMLKEAKVYSGNATAAGAPRRATETGDETTRTITGITGNYYEVNDLASETTYTYKVKAVYIDGTESEWSAANEVTTKAVVTAVSDVAIAADVTEVRYYNVHGQQIARPQQGVNIVVTRYADGSQKALKVVY